VPNDLGLLTKKKWKEKVQWVAAEEAAIIVTLLTQKAASNMTEHGFKPQCGLLVVHAWLVPLWMPLRRISCNARLVITGMSLFSHFSHSLDSDSLFTAQG